MLASTVAFFIAFVLAAFLTPRLRDYAIGRDVMHRGGSMRHVHTGPKPRIGGVAIVIGFFVPLIALLLVDTNLSRSFRADPSDLLAIFGGGLAIALLGVYDDTRGADARLKLAVQFLVALALWLAGVRIDDIHVFGSGSIELGLLSFPVTALWIIGIINAMNLIDGLDGLAAGVALVAIIPALVVASYTGNYLLLVLVAALAGAVLGFLIYNFNPASIFMGDTGSMFLGFVLSTGSIMTEAKSSAAVSMVTPILAMGLPIVDTLLAVFRRSLAGLPVFAADKDHLHHRLLRSGLSHRQTVLVLYSASLVFCGAALVSVFATSWQIALLVLSMALITGVCLRQLGYLSVIARSRSLRQQNRSLRLAVRNAAASLRQARSAAEIWSAVQTLAAHLSVDTVRLTLHGDCYDHVKSKSDVDENQVVSIDIVADGRRVGELSAASTGSDPDISRGDHLALQLLADAIGRAFSNLQVARSSPPEVVPIRRSS